MYHSGNIFEQWKVQKIDFATLFIALNACMKLFLFLTFTKLNQGNQFNVTNLCGLFSVQCQSTPLDNLTSYIYFR